ncbi:MAG: hypothetical protein AAFO94_11230 [Bacteroidota bacterium]
MQAYIKTDQQIHQLCQIIAKANRSYVPKKADDSHTNLYYDALADRVVGRWLSGDQRLLLTINLRDYSFELLNDQLQSQQVYPIAGKTSEALEVAIEKDLAAAGFDTSGFRAELHFKIPAYDFRQMPFDAPEGKGLDQWRQLRRQASEACAALLGHWQVDGEVRIWPHHFDTGIYAKVTERIGIGFGLAMADGMIEVPYYYLSGYPSSGSIDYGTVPDLPKGEWKIGKHWKGAVLRAEYTVSDITLNDFIMAANHFFLDQ